MKIAISAEGPHPDDRVGSKLGVSPYLFLFDLASGEYEVLPNPGETGGRGSGVRLVILAVENDVHTILTGYCNPRIENLMRDNGIEIITGIRATVDDAFKQYQTGKLTQEIKAESSATPKTQQTDAPSPANAFRKTARQFIQLLPVLAGVILLMGLFQIFISKHHLASIFSGNMFLDTLWGACTGSVLAGNPINSYVVADELLRNNVGIFAVTAFLVTWVTVGLVQLPAEASALGKKFALLRNGLSFVLSIPVALVTYAA
jgi:predicted Fe-Mo cluster-binding NifX family protein